MKYNNDSIIATVDDVKEFIRHLVNNRMVNFHPDDRFEDYSSCGDGSETFTQKECVVYDHLMEECFEVCEENRVDIYAIRNRTDARCFGVTTKQQWLQFKQRINGR